MGDSSDSVSIDMEALSLGGQEHVVETTYGPVCVAVCGDPDKPALVTYPDIALNYMFCFQGLLFCPEASSLLLHNFCLYHISPLGHELGAPVISVDAPLLSADDLADQIVEVLNYFGLGAVMCMGVTAGAYVLTLFASRQSMATKTEEELWIDIEALQRKMEKIKPRITSMEQKLESIIERMEKRWAEEDHRAANEAPLQEETLGSASRMVMQLREESPKARTSAPFSGSLLTEISIGEGKAKTASRLKEKSMGFGKAERKETPKLEGEKWTDSELGKNVEKVFERMLLEGKKKTKKRKKRKKWKFIKYKRRNKIRERISVKVMKLFTKKKKKPKEKRQRVVARLWKRTGIGTVLSQVVIGIYELSRNAYILEIIGDKVTVDQMLKAIIRWFMWHCWKTKLPYVTSLAYNILPSQLEDKLKFKGRSKRIENWTRAERQRAVVLTSCQIHSWLSNISAEHESEEDCSRGSAMKFLVSWIATVGEVVGSTTNDRVHLWRHLFSPIQGIWQWNNEWRKGLQIVNLILSTRVKGACGVGFGSSCQDLLTWMEALASSDLDSEPYRNQAKRILGRVMSLLSSLLHCFLRRSYNALENGSDLFQLGKGDNITVFLQRLDENLDSVEDNTWGDYGFITGLGMSLGAIYRAGKSKESNGREKELQQNMANTVEVGLKLLQKQKQRKSSKTWRFKYREIRRATSHKG